MSKTWLQNDQKLTPRKIKKKLKTRPKIGRKITKHRSKIGPWSGPESLLSSWSHRDPPRTLLERTGRPSWTLPGPILGPTWAQLEPTWSQLGPISRQLGANLGSSWAQVASRKPSWAILRPSRGLLKHVKQEIPNFIQKMIEFCSKIDEHLSQKYQKYVNIVAPNAFSRFSNKDLKIFDF